MWAIMDLPDFVVPVALPATVSINSACIFASSQCQLIAAYYCYNIWSCQR